MKVSRAWLQTYFTEELPSAEEIADVLTYHAFEIEEIQTVGNDSVIDVKVLPDRAPDCLSHRGIARELATLLSLRLKRDPLREALPSWDTIPSFTIDLSETTHTTRYMAALIRGVSIKPSPDWLKQSLESIGQKSINNVVDATNYVMHSIGQPLHAFDYSLLQSAEGLEKGIRVRMAHDGESFTSLTGETYTLKSTNQVIADFVSDEALALAGIKGGKQAEVTPKTVDIIIESAHFSPSVVRKTSRELKLATDASVRYQNNPSPLLTAFAVREVVQLIEDIANGKLVGVIDVNNHDYVEHSPLDITLQEINSRLGVSLETEEVESILVRFEWEFSRDGEEFAIVGPWERKDLTLKECFIEEIGRVYDYRKIESKKLPPHEHVVKVNKKQWYIEKIEKLLIEKGYSEVLTYTLDSQGDVELQNPPAFDKAFLRHNLRRGIEKALQLNVPNAPLLGLDMVKIFEIGTVFRRDGEFTSLCLGVHPFGSKNKLRDEIVRADSEDIRTLFSLDPASIHVENGILEVLLDTAITLQGDPDQYEPAIPWNSDARFTAWSSYPFVLRDIAVWVPNDTKKETIESLIRIHGGDLLMRVDMFDTFEKENRTSYAWHLVFQSYNRTLTDAEVNTAMTKIINAIQTTNGCEVR